MLMPKEATFAQPLASLMTWSELPSFLTQNVLPRLLHCVYIIIWKTPTCFIVRRYFFLVPMDMLTMLLFYLYIYFASGVQPFAWENICRNFGKGSLSFALCFLQVHGEPGLLNNGLRLSAFNVLTFPHFGCKSLCTHTTSAVLSQPQLFETA